MMNGYSNPWVHGIHLLCKDRILNILAVCAYHLQRFIELLDTAGLILNEDEAAEASRCLQIHLKSYAVLAEHYFKLRIMMYKIRCKSHYLEHVALEVKVCRVNQNLFHTFQEESFLGKIKAIGVRCHGRSCSHRLFQRYFLCLAIFLEEYRKVDREWEYWNTMFGYRIPHVPKKTLVELRSFHCSFFGPFWPLGVTQARLYQHGMQATQAATPKGM